MGWFKFNQSINWIFKWIIIHLKRLNIKNGKKNFFWVILKLNGCRRSSHFCSNLSSSTPKKQLNRMNQTESTRQLQSKDP